MNDPYVVLGVPRTASDEQVKMAYRELARKYHPDNYASTENPTVSEVFEAKMKEINEAYDAIVTARANGTDAYAEPTQSSASSTAGNYNTQGSYSAYNQQSSGFSSDFVDVRQMINSSRFGEAEQLLDGVPVMRRNAEWYFLRGTVLYHRGWIEQAYEHLSQAVQLDPTNAEYRSAFNVAQQQRSGKRMGYKYSTDSAERGCNPFSICCGLFCADSCCECCGGDMIECC